MKPLRILFGVLIGALLIMGMLDSMIWGEAKFLYVRFILTIILAVVVFKMEKIN